MALNAISHVSNSSSLYATERPPLLLYDGKIALAERIEAIAARRKEQLDEALSKPDWKGRCMVASDILNVGYMGLQGAQFIVTSLATIPAIFWSTFVCGELAGAVNIGMGLLSLREAWKEDCDSLLKMRLFIEGMCLVSIGAIMMIVSLAIKLSALGAVAAALANPWILPVLFLIIAIPSLVEVLKRQVQMRSNEDFMSDSNLKALKKHLVLPETFEKIRTETDIVKKMDSIESKWGINSALEAMQLWSHLLRKEDQLARESIERLETCTSKWKRSQHVRLFEQMLLLGAFGLSVVALNPALSSDRIDAVNSFAVMGANGVAVYPDAAWPTMRNTPIIIPTY
jgi:hypothetical protein